MDAQYIRGYIKDRIETVMGLLTEAIDACLVRAEAEFPEFVSRLECNKEGILKQQQILEEIEMHLTNNDAHGTLHSLSLVENISDFIHEDMIAISIEMTGGEIEEPVVH